MGALFGSSPSIPAFQGTDLSSLMNTASTAAQSNAAGSIALQNQYYPSLYPLTNQTYTALGSNLSNGAAQQITGAPQAANPLLNAATTSTLNQLNMGGQLPPDVAEQVARQAAQGAGQSGFAGGAPTKNIVAQDLGLNSLSLLNQRQQNAASLGTTTAGLNTQQQQLANAVAEFNNSTVPQVNTQRVLGTAGVVSGIPTPVAGLDPGQIASVAIGNNNAQNQYNQQSASILASSNAANAQNTASTIGTVAALAGLLL